MSYFNYQQHFTNVLSVGLYCIILYYTMFTSKVRHSLGITNKYLQQGYCIM